MASSSHWRETYQKLSLESRMFEDRNAPKAAALLLTNEVRIAAATRSSCTKIQWLLM